VSDIEMLQDEIAATRQALKETASALAAKADVKARLSRRAHELTEAVADRAGRVVGRIQRDPLPALVIAVAGLVIVGALVRRGRLRAHP
jgi:Protein of unknown function (DUF3618)